MSVLDPFWWLEQDGDFKEERLWDIREIEVLNLILKFFVYINFF